ncbi:MAG: right-handed parallel beta-helix repeat-containing protein [Planctomycetota bacterium]|jgi:hypothetical protein|nr:right-handed parallel beta-helix repeat-containing protein [Planctomycetota bacterium]
MQIVRTALTGLLLTLGCAFTLPAAENVLPEGQFSSHDQDQGRPAGWAAADPEQAWMRDRFTVMAEGDTSFVRIAEPHGQIMVERILDKGWQELTLRLQSRRADIVPGDKPWQVPGAELAFFDAAGKPLDDWKRSIWLPTNTTGWEVVERAYAVPAGAQTVRCTLGSKAKSGSADFADVQVVVTGGTSTGRSARALQRDLPSRVASLDWSRVTGAQINESQVQAVLHVDQAAVAEGDGSAATPFRSITAGIERAKQLLKDGVPTKISIAAGLYREGEWVIRGDDIGGKAKQTLLVIEGAAPGAVTITGTDQFSDWRKVSGADGAVWYEHDWPHDFGFNPGGWKQHNPKQPYEHRSELMFVDGVPQRQVLMELYRFKAVDPDGVTDAFPGVPQNVGKYGTYTYLGATDPAQLPAGSFGVFERPENGDKLVWKPAPGVDPATASVEVAVRRYHLWVHRKGEVVLRNLDFRAAAGRIEAHAAVMLGHWYQPRKTIVNRNALVENCRFIHNNSNQLSIRSFSNVTVRKVEANYGGYGGISMGTIHNVLWEDTRAAFNNWRVDGGWSSGGVKIHRTTDMITRRHTAIGNNGTGLWYDVACGDVLVEEMLGVDNKMSFDWEISNGVLVRDSVFVDDHKTAAAIVSGEDVVFERCLMAGSPAIGLLTFQAGDREVDSWNFAVAGLDRLPRSYKLDRLELRDCAIVSWDQPSDSRGTNSHNGVYDAGWSPYVFYQGHGNPDWFETYVNQGVKDVGTLWYASRDDAFGIRKSYYDNWRSKPPVCATVDYANWSQRVAAEGSRWLAPHFIDPAKYDLRSEPDCPLAQAKTPQWQLSASALAELRAYRAAGWHASDVRSEVDDVIVTGETGR